MARARISGATSLSGNSNDGIPIATPAVSISDPDDLPVDIFTKEVNLKESKCQQKQMLY